MAETQPTPMTLTRLGLRVLAQGLVELPIKITRVSVGDGYLPDGTVIKDMTELIHEVRDVPINRKQVIGDGHAQIDTIISNMGLTSPYRLREVGVWAVDNDTGEEVLYAYGNYGDDAIMIPAAGGVYAVNFVYQILIEIDQVPDIEIVITEGYGFATQDDIDTSIDSLFREPAQIERFWTADESEPRKLRPATGEDVVRYLFEHTATDDEPVLIGFRPNDKKIFGIKLSRFVVQAEGISGGNPSMTEADYPDTLSGGNPSMREEDYEGTVSGGDPSTI